MMTQPWPQIVARYEDYKGEVQSIHTLGRLARRISESPLERSLFASPHMFDLDIVQIPVSDPFDGPFLRLSPVLSEDRIEFRYIDTYDKAKQWHRMAEADQAWARLIKFLDQLGWFPINVLEPLINKKP
jgi:hypothetical protein